MPKATPKKPVVKKTVAKKNPPVKKSAVKKAAATKKPATKKEHVVKLASVTRDDTKVVRVANTAAKEAITLRKNLTKLVSKFKVIQGMLADIKKTLKRETDSAKAISRIS